VVPPVVNIKPAPTTSNSQGLKAGLVINNPEMPVKPEVTKMGFDEAFIKSAIDYGFTEDEAKAELSKLV
jgi:hypothetical protein